jgi:hypothetical protein
MVTAQTEHGFGFTHDVARPPLLLGLGGSRQMLLNRHCHDSVMAADNSRGQARLASRVRFAHKPGDGCGRTFPDAIDR